MHFSKTQVQIIFKYQNVYFLRYNCDFYLNEKAIHLHVFKQELTPLITRMREVLMMKQNMGDVCI